MYRSTYEYIQNIGNIEKCKINRKSIFIIRRKILRKIFELEVKIIFLSKHLREDRVLKIARADSELFSRKLTCHDIETHKLLNRWCSKVGSVFTIVIWSAFRMWQYRDYDHLDEAPHFKNRIENRKKYKIHFQSACLISRLNPETNLWVKIMVLGSLYIFKSGIKTISVHLIFLLYFLYPVQSFVSNESKRLIALGHPFSNIV